MELSNKKIWIVNPIHSDHCPKCGTQISTLKPEDIVVRVNSNLLSLLEPNAKKVLLFKRTLTDLLSFQEEIKNFTEDRSLDFLVVCVENELCDEVIAHLVHFKHSLEVISPEYDNGKDRIMGINKIEGGAYQLYSFVKRHVPTTPTPFSEKELREIFHEN